MQVPWGYITQQLALGLEQVQSDAVLDFPHFAQVEIYLPQVLILLSVLIFLSLKFIVSLQFLICMDKIVISLPEH